MSFLKHFFRRHSCAENLSIDDAGNRFTPALICTECNRDKCNRDIGFIYFDGDTWKAFVYSRFMRHKSKIERWVYENTKNRNHMGDTCGQRWEDSFCYFKQCCENDVLPVGCEKRAGECEKISESNEPDESREGYIMGIDLSSGADARV